MVRYIIKLVINIIVSCWISKFDTSIDIVEKLIIKFAAPASENLKKLFIAVAEPKLDETNCNDWLNRDVDPKLRP
ncbi:hypothetical protein fsci_15460 [Francisella sciaenopsi]|uniref:Uncharacterized protein n=1 Tax=Francisella sciaenopsi TaxID=3055034 RepID=A0ABQ6PGI5_9GAMM